MSTTPSQRFKQVVPLLQVGDMAETLAYYEQVLDFRLDFAWPSTTDPKWAQLSRDATSFLFTIDLGTSSAPFIAEKGNGVVLYIVVDDVIAVHAELVARGALIVQDLHDFGGRRQCSIADPNGYVLAFSEPFA